MLKCSRLEEIFDMQPVPDSPDDFVPVLIEEHCTKFDCSADCENCKHYEIDR